MKIPLYNYINTMARCCKVCKFFPDENTQLTDHFLTDAHIINARAACKRKYKNDFLNMTIADMKNKLICPICGYKLKYQNGFDRHMECHNEDYTSIGSKDINCKNCNQSFESHHEFTEHELICESVQKLIKAQTELMEKEINDKKTKIKKEEIRQEAIKEDTKMIEKIIAKNIAEIKPLKKLSYLEYLDGIADTRGDHSAYKFTRRFIEEYKKGQLNDYVANMIFTCSLKDGTAGNTAFDGMNSVIKAAQTKWLEDRTAGKLKQFLITPVVQYILGIFLKCYNYQNGEVKNDISKIPDADIRSREILGNFAELKELVNVDDEMKQQSFTDKITEIIAGKFGLVLEDVVEDIETK